MTPERTDGAAHRASPSERTLDRLFEHGRTYAHAAGSLNYPEPELPYLFSVLLAHQRRIAELSEQVEDLQEGPSDAVQD